MMASTGNIIKSRVIRKSMALTTTSIMIVIRLLVNLDRLTVYSSHPLVIDMLVFKGTEELANVVEHSKQRHHIIGQYVVGRQDLFQDSGVKDPNVSPFLKNFYTTNYF
ncbi:hypothetical protein KSS87_021058 [Heliosperma pusillum]|nr:hypothetical protein KSS87_017878 [Heliosperma pusillum]KAH9605580.1 hypothetical protein KSS87_021058 [Heliosperma pusillum]